MVMGERDLEPEQIDQYLCYVHQEEEKGTRYAEIAELVEDITDFTRENVFHWDPAMVWLFQAITQIAEYMVMIRRGKL